MSLSAVQELTEIDSLLQERFGSHQFDTAYSGAQEGVMIISQDEWQELKIDDFIEKLHEQNLIKTPVGKWGLSRTLVPTSNGSLIAERQEQLRALKDQELFDRLARTLHVASDECTTLDWYLKNKDKSLGSLAPYYFQTFDTYLNNNELILSGSFAVEAVKRIAFLVAPLGLKGFNDQMGLDFVQDNHNMSTYLSPGYWWQGIKQGLMAPFRLHSLQPSMLITDQDIENARNRPGGIYQQLMMGNSTLGDLYNYGSKALGWNKVTVGALAALLCVGHDVYLGLQIKGTVDYLRDLWAKPLPIAQKLTHLGKAIRAYRALAKKLKCHPAFQSPHSKRILALLACDKQLFSEDFNKAVELVIEISKNSSLNVMLRGRVLLAHKLLVACSSEFASHLASVGYIDALCAMAELYQRHSQIRPWSFVNFVHSQVPHITARNSWCPLIEGQDPVLNTIVMGDQNQRVMICTGPNGGGKSTIMKGLAYQVAIGQSWGIAPAESCTMSLFGSLRTALDPHEDIKKGLSSFMAQRKRMNELAALAHAEKALPMMLLVDEPYRGTVEATSQQMVTSFCSSIGECESAAMFLATHFQQPTTLADQNGAIFENVQCLFDVDETGRMYRTFKLAPGAATWWFTDDHARSQYLSMLEAEVA